MLRSAGRTKAIAGATLLVATLVLVAPASVASATSSETRVLTCTQSAVERPVTYVLTCATYNAEWLGVTWSSWSDDSASGSGTLSQNACQPSCSSGHFVRYSASVTLLDVVHTRLYGSLFSEAVVHFDLNGRVRTEEFALYD